VYVGCGVVVVWIIKRTGVRRVNCVPCRSLFKCFSDMQCLSSIHLPQSPQNPLPGQRRTLVVPQNERQSVQPNKETLSLSLYICCAATKSCATHSHHGLPARRPNFGCGAKQSMSASWMGGSRGAPSGGHWMT